MKTSKKNNKIYLSFEYIFYKIKYYYNFMTQIKMGRKKCILEVPPRSWTFYSWTITNNINQLFRVEELRVEDMMKRSFAELGTQKQQAGYKERAVQLTAQVQNMPDISGTGFYLIIHLMTKIICFHSQNSLTCFIFKIVG